MVRKEIAGMPEGRHRDVSKSKNVLEVTFENVSRSVSVMQQTESLAPAKLAAILQARRKIDPPGFRRD
jgi:hypothetical protein